jgi:hypothetical protein
MINIISAVACHFIGDFPFQTEYLALNKGKSWEIMFYHCAVYIALFALMGANTHQLLALLVSHYAIDTLKARYGFIKTIWEDQVAHFVILWILFT